MPCQKTGGSKRDIRADGEARVAGDLAIQDFAEPIEHTIDARGLLCPEPLMIVRNYVRKMATGERVAIVATDPSTRRDFANFCRFMGHALLVDQARGDRFEFVIQKSDDQ